MIGKFLITDTLKRVFHKKYLWFRFIFLFNIGVEKTPPIAFRADLLTAYLATGEREHLINSIYGTMSVNFKAYFTRYYTSILWDVDRDRSCDFYNRVLLKILSTYTNAKSQCLYDATHLQDYKFKNLTKSTLFSDANRDAL